MEFFFIKDYRNKYRFFASELGPGIGEKTSKTKEAWRRAKEKLLLLPPRIRRQEQAFMDILKEKKDAVVVRHSGLHSESKLRFAFFFYLQRQRSKHILLLIGEILLLPLSGLAAWLPGPNVAFYILALLILTHWQALRGINRLGRKKLEFVPATVFSDWEETVAQGDERRYAEILGRLEREFNLPGLAKILWK